MSTITVCLCLLRRFRLVWWKSRRCLSFLLIRENKKLILSANVAFTSPFPVSVFAVLCDLSPLIRSHCLNNTWILQTETHPVSIWALQYTTVCTFVLYKYKSFLKKRNKKYSGWAVNHCSSISLSKALKILMKVSREICGDRCLMLLLKEI